MPQLSHEQLVARCTQLQSDNNSTVNQAEDAKKELDKITAKTWELVVKILSKKQQTPDQAFAELKASQKISDEVFKNIQEGASGLELLQKIEAWFGGVVSGLDLVAYLGLGGYIRFSAKPGLAKAQLAKQAAEEALETFKTRSRYISRVMGSKSPAALEGMQKQIQLETRLVAAAEKEALAAQKVTKASRLSKRIGRFGLWAFAASLVVAGSLELYSLAKEKQIKEENFHALQQMYTSRFYMTVQARYLEFLVHHVSHIHDYATLVDGGNQAAADMLLHTWVSEGAEIDPATSKVNPSSTKEDSWSASVVKALLADHDKSNHQEELQKDDPDDDTMARIHEEQLKQANEKLLQQITTTKADIAAGKSDSD